MEISHIETCTAIMSAAQQLIRDICCKRYRVLTLEEKCFYNVLSTIFIERIVKASHWIKANEQENEHIQRALVGSCYDSFIGLRNILWNNYAL